ncbi:unnamed protein product [Nyctereutes procyonoides]|uniref:(raccoon dog) hypothetical protein n=1 Tax=Nyctereutes procyonoides TaxID=34880 RepID=A0A811Z2F5_NYCPR|nr:unnamed protein product [Nyctereutes procyonoides]
MKVLALLVLVAVSTFLVSGIVSDATTAAPATMTLDFQTANQAVPDRSPPTPPPSAAPRWVLTVKESKGAAPRCLYLNWNNGDIINEY